MYADTLSIDKSNYTFGDTIRISGKLSYAAGNFIGLQILNPQQSDIVVIDQFLPKSDGTFSKSYKTQGPKWIEEGMYSIKVVYNEQVFEKQFSFKKPELPIEEPNPPMESNQNTTTTQPIKPLESLGEKPKKDPKLIVAGFPNPTKSPNYYFDRYFSENEYKYWFDSTFEGLSIFEVVGYKSTHIEGFPDNEKSAWYYVDRYNTEEQYRDWFDSQFPAKSIFEVLGYPESLFQKAPDWIKNNAKWWSDGMISDSEFLNGIEFLIKEKIIQITYNHESIFASNQNIPVWIKNTAKWWADGQIDENEFLKGITFLIENKIIII
ncbi:MAG: hypothetical protein OEL77_06960 [Nitrosopumilus sp.]|nr:hypothetical protein [Nitrosopumilus sp.]MDH3385735.1 hypothetical protein [Nitrosopumilus sp.]